jgi:hypothetical protein
MPSGRSAGRDGSRQILVEWDIQTVTGLPLANADRPFPDVLATHANDVRSALSSIEEQFGGEALPAAELTPDAKLFDIDFRPRAVTATSATKPELAALGHVGPSGQPYHAGSIRHMLAV